MENKPTTQWMSELKQDIHNEIHLLVARVQYEESLSKQIEHGNDFVERFYEMFTEAISSQLERIEEEAKPEIAKIQDLIWQIEKCGASPELTKAVIMAGEVKERLLQIINQQIEGIK